MKIIVLVCALLLALSSESEAQLLHDISADSILGPGPGQVMFPGFPVATVARFTNRGTSDESNCPLVFVVMAANKTMVYRDTASIALKTGQTVDVSFSQFTPQGYGRHLFCAIAILSTDQDSSDNMTCGSAVVRPDSDYHVEPVAIFFPKLNDTLPAGQPFQPIVIFRNMDTVELQGLKAFVGIHRCSDSQFMGQVQNAIPSMPADSVPVFDTLPCHQWSFDDKSLLPGCYQIEGRIWPNYRESVSSTFTIFAQHDISADSILSPGPQVGEPIVPVDLPIATRAQFTNRGASDETNIEVILRIADSSSSVVYSDTTFIASLKIGQSVNVSFAQWTPQHHGRYEVCARSLLPSDQDSVDDQVCNTTLIKNLDDVQALRIEYPTVKDTLPLGLSFEPLAFFRNVGAPDLDSVPVTLVIRRCSDQAYVGQLQALIQNLSTDSSVCYVYFIIPQRWFNTSMLPPGCYQIAAIANFPGDVNHSNDTAYSTFTIVSKSDVISDAGSSQGLAILGTFPNPTSTLTTLAYSLPESGDVTLRLLDVTGREILRSIAREDAGEHQIPIQTQGLELGIYLCQLTFVNARGEVSRAYTKMIVSGTR